MEEKYAFYDGGELIEIGTIKQISKASKKDYFKLKSMATKEYNEMIKDYKNLVYHLEPLREKEMLSLLYSLVDKESIKVGDVYNISYCFDNKLSKHYNKILIINLGEKPQAVWYDEEYKGMPYVILPYQVFINKIGEVEDLEKYFEGIEYRWGIATNNDIVLGGNYEMV